MGQGQSKLNVRLSGATLRKLEEIANWSAAQFGESIADEYVKRLIEEIHRLAEEPLRGKEVPGLAQFRFITIRNRPRRHGHIAVYRIKGSTVEIINIYHTAQDWPSKLDRED